MTQSQPPKVVRNIATSTNRQLSSKGFTDFVPEEDFSDSDFEGDVLEAIDRGDFDFSL